MSEKKLGKRLLTWVLVLVMTLSTLPLNVLAAYGYDDRPDSTNYSTTFKLTTDSSNGVSLAYVTDGNDPKSGTLERGESVTLSTTNPNEKVTFSIIVPSGYTAGGSFKHTGGVGNLNPIYRLYDDVQDNGAIGYFYYTIKANSGSSTPVSMTIAANPIDYNVKYNFNGGSSNPEIVDGNTYRHSNTANVNGTYSSTIIIPNSAPSKDGYEFKGWLLSGSNRTYQPGEPINVDEYWYTQNVVGNTIKTGNGTFNLIAQWEPIPVEKHTVTFNSNGGSNVSSQEVDHNATASKPADPTRSGYTFDGWYNESLTEAYDFNTLVITDIILYAKWTANPDTKYKVEHYQQNLENDEYTLEETDSDLAGMTGALTAAQAKNYEGFTAQSFTQETIAADGSTLVKIYYNRNSYKVTYQYTEPVPTDATTLPTEEEYKYGAEVTVADAATATGYTFNGWNKAESFTMPAKDVTITGSWTPIKYDYTINYVDKDTNKTLDTVSGTADFKSTLTLDSVKKDITGYNYDSADKNFLTIGITETDNVITLYYTKDTASYTVNYYWNGTTNPVHDSKTVSGKTIGSTVTEVPISIANCTPVSNSSQEISISSSGENVIIFYYYKNVELTANSATLTYNGEEQSVSGFTGAPDEVNFSDITVGATGTNAGSYDAKFPDGTVGKVDSTAKYIITAAKDGKLVISPYAGEITVKVTGKIESKVYDGTVQTVSGYDVEITGGDGLYTADNVTYRSDTPSVSGTNVEGSPYEMNLKGTDFDYESPNFTNLKIIVTGGSLTITPREVTLTSGSDKKVYDGTALTKDEVIATGFVGSDSATYTVTGSIINAGKAANSFTYELTDDTIASNYTIKQEYGELEIIPVTEKVTVTIKGNTKSVTYNGSEQSVSGYEITFDNQLYKKEYVKLTGDAVAKGTNRGTYYMGLAAEKFENINDNFTNVAFEVTDGKLEITRRPVTPPSRPTTPTIEIDDDDALGLNTTDHFAYIVGYGNGEVRPQNNITRAEVATIFFRLLTDDVRDANLSKTNRYSDVADTAWYNTAVSTLSAMGIITGYPDGTFRPNAAITRAEFAAIAARFDTNGDKTTAAFTDIASHWAKDEISIAANNGWIKGYEDNTFRPQRDITRAETMTLVNRVLNRQPETEDDLLPNMAVWTDNADKNAWYYLAVQEATNSHYYEFKTNSVYEKWTELRETRDWTQLEK